MTKVVLGVETEYAATGFGPDGSPVDRSATLEAILRQARARIPHIPDATSRGMFVQNGSRLYIDHPDKLELATAECGDPWEVVRYVQAGERLLGRLANAAVESQPELAAVSILRCNVDYSGTGSTWGCHESYLHQIEPRALPRQIIPFLVSRLCWSGAGGFNNRGYGLEFTLSPRVCHLRRAVSADSQSNRGIYHTKDEPLSHHRHHRLHILCGETLCSETASWLRIGATALVVAMVDGGILPGDAVGLASPLDAMRRIARDPTCRAAVTSATGERLTALDIQHHYLQLAEAHVGAPFMPPWANEVCQRWRDVLERLQTAPESLATTLDWAIKLALFKSHARRRGFDWETVELWDHIATELSLAGPETAPRGLSLLARDIRDRHGPFGGQAARIRPLLRKQGLAWEDWDAFAALRNELFEIDMRFGQLATGIFATLDRSGLLDHAVPGLGDVDRAMEEPPGVPRARLRGKLIRQLARENTNLTCEWTGITDCGKKRGIDMGDPFAPQAEWQPWSPSRIALHDACRRLPASDVPRSVSRRGWSPF